MRIGEHELSTNLFLSPLASYTNLPFRLTIREIGGLGWATTDLVNARSLIEGNRMALANIQSRLRALFGEPAVLFHLHQAGLNVSPVQDVEFSQATFDGEPLPTYLVLGPNALRTEEMLYEWTVAQYRFEHVADFHFAPSDVVLFNLFSPEFVNQHDEAYVQKLELYRGGTHRRAVGVAGE